MSRRSLHVTTCTSTLLTLLAALSLSFVLGDPRPCHAQDWTEPTLESFILSSEEDTGGEGFGARIAIDGSTVIVSRDSQNEAVIYRFGGTSWNEEATLFGSGISGNGVEIEGDRALLGARWSGSAVVFGGAVHAFTFDGEVEWTDEQIITASDPGLGDLFGVDIALDDGTLLVGAYLDDTVATDAGAVYMYRQDGAGLWVEEDSFVASTTIEGDRFGVRLAIDGDVAVIGAPGELTITTDRIGSAYIFRFDDVGWNEEAFLSSSDGEVADYFGAAVAIEDDVAVVGALGADAAYVFRYDGTSWVEEQILTASDGLGADDFGLSVEIRDGRIVVGAGQHDLTGAAYVYEYDGVTWREVAKLEPSDPLVTDFGASVAIDRDTVLVGATSSPGGIGAVYGYSLFDSSSVAVTISPAPAELCAGDAFTIEASIEGAASFAYQWLKDGVVLDGENLPTLAVNDVLLDDAGEYQVEITVDGRTIASETVEVTVADCDVEFVATAADRVTCVGDPTTFSVDVLAAGELEYQWRRNGDPVAGATFPTFEIAATDLPDAGSYDVTVAHRGVLPVCDGLEDEVLVTSGSFVTPSGFVFGPTVSGLPFQPKALLFWGAAVPDDSVTLGASAFYGFIGEDGNEFGVALQSDDGIGDTAHRQEEGSGLVILPPGESNFAVQASLFTFNSDGFTLAFATSESGHVVNFVAFGGDGLEARAGSFSGDDGAVGGLPFRPSIVFTTALGSGTGVRVEERSSFGIGAFAPTANGAVDQWFASSYQGRNEARLDQVHSFLSEGIVAARNAGDALGATVSVTEVDADGFRFSGEVPGRVGYLALHTGDREVAVGTFAKETTGVDGTVESLPDLGFVPQVLAFATGGKTSDALTPDGCRFGYGMAFADSEGGFSYAQPAGVSTTSRRQLDDSTVLVADGDVLVVAGSIDALDSNTPEITWSPNSTDAIEIGYWAIEGAGGEDPPCAEAVSEPAVLVVSAGPTIVAPPVGGTVPFSEAFEFTVEAVDTVPILYQWRKDGVDIPGATGDTLTIVAAAPSDEGEYSVVVANDCGSEVSAPVELVVDGPFFLRGDVDGSGAISALVDAIFLLQFGFSAGDAPPCGDAADVDDNGSVAPLVDSLFLLSYGFSSGIAPPDPGPSTCGEDPTDDDGLDCAIESPTCR